jgi:hypothetical protein
MMMLIRVIVVSATALTLACGGGGSSPAAPTPTPTPPAPAPLPVVTFTPDVATPGNLSLSVQVASRLAEPGKINLAVVATGLVGVYNVRGDLLWNPDLLEFDTWGEGDWLKQGGAVVDWAFFVGTPGQIGLVLGRSDAYPPATGSGEVFLFRLRPRSGVTSGSSRLTWEDGRVEDSASRALDLNRVSGGTITIR